MASLILIVDDELLNRELLETMLGAYGYTTVTASNGLKALEQAQKHQPDLILMDIRMPKLDGYETTANLKADTTVQHIPVVLFSGLKTSPEERRHATEAGAVDVLQRGMDMESLMQYIRKHLPND